MYKYLKEKEKKRKGVVMKKEKGKKAHLKAQLNPQTLSPASSLPLSHLSLSRTRPPPPAPTPDAARACARRRLHKPVWAPAAARSSSSPTGDLRRMLLHPHRRRRQAADAYGSAYPIGEGLILRLTIRAPNRRLVGA